MEASWIVSAKAEKFVQAERGDAREVHPTGFELTDERFIDWYRCPPGGDSQHEVRLGVYRGHDVIGDRTRGPFRRWKNPNVHPQFYSS